MNKKNRSFISIIIILSVVIVLVGVYYLGIIEPKTPITVLSTESISGWKEYKNSDFGYSIRYPMIWEANETTNIKGGLDLMGLGVGTKSTMLRNNMLLLVNDSATIIGDKQICTQVGCLDRDAWDEMVIDGVDGYSADFYPRVPGGFDKTVKVRVVIFKDRENKNIYVISQQRLVEKENEFLDWFDQIISTFKFIN